MEFTNSSSLWIEDRTVTKRFRLLMISVFYNISVVDLAQLFRAVGLFLESGRANTT